MRRLRVEPPRVPRVARVPRAPARPTTSLRETMAERMRHLDTHVLDEVPALARETEAERMRRLDTRGWEDVTETPAPTTAPTLAETLAFPTLGGATAYTITPELIREFAEYSPYGIHFYLYQVFRTLAEDPLDPYTIAIHRGPPAGTHLAIQRPSLHPAVTVLLPITFCETRRLFTPLFSVAASVRLLETDFARRAPAVGPGETSRTPLTCAVGPGETRRTPLTRAAGPGETGGPRWTPRPIEDFEPIHDFPRVRIPGAGETRGAPRDLGTAGTTCTSAGATRSDYRVPPPRDPDEQHAPPADARLEEWDIQTPPPRHRPLDEIGG
jgi:hypothetical protein